jgi:quercetin dioxygenase-like cupin family protein
VKYLHLKTGADGISHFADGEIALSMTDFAPPATPMMVSDAWPAERVVFLTLPAGWTGPRHPSPCRQVAFCLSGRLRVTAGSGEVREIGPGGIWLMEDTDGPGHHSEVAGDAPCHLAIAQVD